MPDPRDELAYADLANEPGWVPPRELLRIRVSPYDTPPPTDTGWGGFGSGGRPTGRLFEPDLEPAPPPEQKPAFQPGLLSLGNVARGIGSLVQGAGQPAAPPAATAPPFVAPPRGRSTAPFDPMAGVRPDSYPKTAQPTFGENLATGVGHAATEVLQEPYNMVRAGQDIAAPGATDRQVQQAREQEAAAATNLTSNMIGANAPFSAARPGASAGLFGGRLSPAADQKAFDLAERMQQRGASEGHIRNVTGLTLFPDKKFRFEVSDKKAYYKGIPDAYDPEKVAKNIFLQANPNATEKDFGSSLYRLSTLAARQVAEQRIANLPTLKWSDLMHHPEAEKAFPYLKDMPVEIDHTMVGLGAYGPPIKRGQGSGVFKLRPTDNDPRGQTFKVLLHEPMHKIQDVERFALGGNPDYIPLNSPAYKIYQDKLAQLRAQNIPISPEAEQAAYSAAGREHYRRLAGENEANVVMDRLDLSPEQAKSINPLMQMRVKSKDQIVDFGDAEQLPLLSGGRPQMGGVLNPAPREMQMSGPSGLLRPPGRTMKEPNWLPVAPTVIDPQRVLKPGIYQNPRIIAEKANEKVAAEHPALNELFGVTRHDLYDISQQGRRQGNMEPDLFFPKKPGTSYAGANIQTPANEQRLIDTLSEGLKHRGLREGMVPWYVMDPMFQQMVKLVGKEQAIKDYQRMNATVPPFSASSDVLTEINRGTAANMYAKRGDYETFHRYGGADRNKLPAGFPEDMSGVMGHAYHDVQSSPVMRWLATGKHGYNPETVKIPTYIAASGVPETGFQTRWAVPDAHIARGSGMSDVRRTKSPGDYMGGSEYRTFAPWYREKIAEPLGLEAVPTQALQWGTFGHATGVDTPIGAGKLELFSQRIWERARELGIDPKRLRDEVLQGNAHALRIIGIGGGAGAAGMGSLVDPGKYQPGGS